MVRLSIDQALFARRPAVFETFASVEDFLQSGDLDRTGCVVLPA